MAKTDTMPKGSYCPIGSLNLHTMNHEDNECIWCGPHYLAGKRGKWVDKGKGFSAWSVKLHFHDDGTYCAWDEESQTWWWSVGRDEVKCSNPELGVEK